MKHINVSKKEHCYKARKIPSIKLRSILIYIFLCATILNNCQPKSKTYTYKIYSNHSSPEGVIINLWKNGMTKFENGIVKDSAYKIVFFSDENIYFDSITAVKQDYIPYNSGHIVIDNGNTELNINLEPLSEDKIFWFYGNNCSPVGTCIKIYEDNRILEENLFINEKGNYESKKLYIPTDQTIDSIIFSKQGYIQKNYTNITVHTAANLLNVQLDAIQGYRYYLTGTECSPESTLVKVFYDAAQIASDYVINGNYLTDFWYNADSIMTIDSIVCEHISYDKMKIEKLEVSKGQNYLEVNLNKTEAYSYYLSGTHCSPEGTYIEVWNNKQYLAYAYVKDSIYQTEAWSSEDSTLTIDSIRFMHEGYIKQTHTNFKMKPGKNVLNVQLDKEKKK